MSFPLISIIAPAALGLFIYMRSSTRKASFNTEEFFEKERQANSVRKQPITDIDFIQIDLDSIPFKDSDNEILTDAQNMIKILSEKKIANLSDYTNTDLKFKYGVANLSLLTEFDQNYTQLCRSLFDMARELRKEGDNDSALKVLEYGIKCNTDMKSHYLLLADIYEERGQYDKINDLIQSAQGIKSLLKNSLIRDLEAKMPLPKEAQELQDILLNK